LLKFALAPSPPFRGKGDFFNKLFSQRQPQVTDLKLDLRLQRPVAAGYWLSAVGEGYVMRLQAGVSAANPSLRDIDNTCGSGCPAANNTLRPVGRSW
jgi:hypothetical protein